MIRRSAGFKHFDLITQHDHALLAGDLARHYGNIAFAAMLPLDAAVAGVNLHDAGWQDYDREPTLNARGLPLHVFDVPVGVAVRVWGASVDQAIQAGDYAGLLVSLHVLNLSALFLSNAIGFRSAEPAGKLSRSDQFEMNKFQHRQVEIQETLRARLGFANDTPRQMGLADRGASPADDQLRYNFSVLALLDRVSLSLCCGRNLFPHIDEVHPAPGEEPISLNLFMRDDTTLVIAPWPFSADEIRLNVPAKRVKSEPWENVTAFQAACAGANVHHIELVLRQG